MSAVSFKLNNNNRAMSSQSRNSQSLNNLQNPKPSSGAQGPRIAVNDAKAVVSTVKAPTPNARIGQQIVQGNTKPVNETANKAAVAQKKVENQPKNAQKAADSGYDCPLHGRTSLYDAERIRENMRKSFLANPHVTMDNEAEYYETVRRLDICGHCWAAQQKFNVAPFKLMEKGPGLTLYQKDYVKHPLEKGPVMKNDFYNTFNIEEPMDFGTTMRNDYKPWPIGEIDRPTMHGKSGASGVPFAGRSGYKTEYIDWGKIPVVLEKAANNVTVISELPFVGKTAYQENFAYQPGEQAKPMDRDLWKVGKKSPISPGIPFLGETTHNKTFKPYRVGGNPFAVAKEEFEPTEAYPDQYNSIYKKDYNPADAAEKWKCPAKIFMETNPHPKQWLLKP